MSGRQSRSEVVSIRVNPDDLDVIQTAAEKRGQTLSAFLRAAAIAAVMMPTEPTCGCGTQNDLAWVAVYPGSVKFGDGPFGVTGTAGSMPWTGWKCRRCCLRDHGAYLWTAVA